MAITSLEQLIAASQQDSALATSRVRTNGTSITALKISPIAASLARAGDAQPITSAQIAPGSSAVRTVVNGEPVVLVTGPQGDVGPAGPPGPTGAQGDPGIAVEFADIDPGTGNLFLTLDNGVVLDAGRALADISIGTVSFGDTAAVSISGTAPSQTINFQFPTDYPQITAGEATADRVTANFVTVNTDLIAARADIRTLDSLLIGTNRLEATVIAADTIDALNITATGGITGNIIGPDSTVIVNSALARFRGDLEGSLTGQHTGDVLSAGSAVIVDHVTSTITGTLNGTATQVSNALSAGTGLTFGSAVTYNGSTARTITIDGTVVVTSGNQSIAGTKTFTNGVRWTGVAQTDCFGYGTGAGGTASQTGIAGAVTLNRPTGEITLASVLRSANTANSFVVNNTSVSSGDHIIVTHVSGGSLGSYVFTAGAGGNQQFTVFWRNVTANNLTEQPVIKFTVIKSVTA